MVNKAEALFTALHLIILAFFNKLGVFSPAIVNGLLVAFGAYHAINQVWGPEYAWTGAIVAGVAMEAAGIGLSWNLDITKKRSLAFISLYLAGSWSLVWWGLNQGWLIDLLGGIMPLFAVALQTTIPDRENREAEVEAALETAQIDREIAAQEREFNLAMKKEDTKQAQAAARQEKAKAQAAQAQEPVTLIMPQQAERKAEQPRGEAEQSKAPLVQQRTAMTLEFMADNPNASERQLAAHLQCSPSVAHNYMKKWKENRL